MLQPGMEAARAACCREMGKGQAAERRVDLVVFRRRVQIQGHSDMGAGCPRPMDYNGFFGSVHVDGMLLRLYSTPSCYGVARGLGLSVFV
ncbi:hypothetical protein ACP70R_001491 [Stipagrostis hirtigluma subsp. patula]